MIRRPPRSTLFPTRRSSDLLSKAVRRMLAEDPDGHLIVLGEKSKGQLSRTNDKNLGLFSRSEEHTSELQSLTNLVCRLLLEKKKKKRQSQVKTLRIKNTMNK